MICVTIGRGRHSSLAEEWKAAAEAGVELVELRIDCLRREPDLKRILAEAAHAAASSPSAAAPTAASGAATRRSASNCSARRSSLGVDYVDLEMDIATKIRRFGKTKRIVSYHNFKETPDEHRRHRRAVRRDRRRRRQDRHAGLRSVADASRVLQARRQGQGADDRDRDGRARRLHPHPRAGSSAPRSPTPASTPSGSSRPGCCTIQTLKRDYFYDQINAETEVYAVIGDPIEQSLSPAIHNAAFRHLGLNKVMVPFLIPAGKLAESLKELEWLGIKGFSVTIPHKEDVVPLLTSKDGAVERTGSCNTVIVQDGKKLGYNTDYRAAMDSLEDALRRADRGGRQPAVREAGADPRGGGRRPFDRLRPGPPRGERHASPTATTTAPPRWPRRSAAGPSPGRCGPARSPTSSSTARRSACTPTSTTSPLPPAAFNKTGHGRLRHDLPPREHDDPEAGARARLHGRSPASTCSSARRRSSSSSTPGRTPRSTSMRDALKRKLGPLRE